MRSNREVPKPSTSTWTLLMVGGSCRWSPTRVTQASGFIFIKGTKEDSSVAWAASSNNTRTKVMCWINGWSAPEQVLHTTSASLRICFCRPNCVLGSIPFLVRWTEDRAQTWEDDGMMKDVGGPRKRQTCGEVNMCAMHHVCEYEAGCLEWM